MEAKPGITGLWQVTARQDPSFTRCVELDTEYIRNWSVLLDIKILCRTVLAVLQGSGA
jgi:lipopolysaccharide/colanic/teichoic acid biosynthesis glycosyltransferase